MLISQIDRTHAKPSPPSGGHACASEPELKIALLSGSVGLWEFQVWELKGLEPASICVMISLSSSSSSVFTTPPATTPWSIWPPLTRLSLDWPTVLLDLPGSISKPLSGHKAPTVGNLRAVFRAMKTCVSGLDANFRHLDANFRHLDASFRYCLQARISAPEARKCQNAAL